VPSDTPYAYQPSSRASVEKWTGLQIGPAITLLRVDEIFHEFEKFGMTRKGFNSFLRAIGVPTIRLPSADLIDMNTFAVAMRCICRIGSSDFYAPGHQRISSGTVPSFATTRIDKDRMTREWQQVIAEIVSFRKSKWLTTSEEVSEQMALAIDRIALSLAEATTIELRAADAEALNDLQSENPLLAPSKTPATMGGDKGTDAATQQA